MTILVARKPWSLCNYQEVQVVRDSIRVTLSAFHCDEALHAFHDISGINGTLLLQFRDQQPRALASATNTRWLAFAG
jgi:hypothetical protein